MTPEQQALIEQLYENESLTANLTDGDAKAVLAWAQQQIIADADGELVRAAVSAANESGQAGAQTLITQAANFLAQELQVRAQQTATPSNSDAPELKQVAEMDARSTNPQDSAKLGVSGAASEQSLLTANADATIGAATAIAPTPPTSAAKKSRAKSKRKKKSKP